MIFAKLGRNWLMEKLAKGMRIGNIPAEKLPMVNPKPFRDQFDGSDPSRRGAEGPGLLFYRAALPITSPGT